MLTTIKVTTHSGDEDLVQGEIFDATEMETKWNNEELQGIKIGDNVYSRIDLRGVKLIQDDERTTLQDLPDEEKTD